MAFNLELLLQQPEGKTLEFKRNLSSTENILKTLVAFANTAGGVLLIGVEDESHSLLGVSKPFDEEVRLCNLIADSIRPRLTPNIEMISRGEIILLVVEVFPSGLRPHYLKNRGEQEGVFVRLGSTNRQADSQLIAELNRTVAGIGFDEMPLPDLTTDAIDWVAAKAAFKPYRELDEQTSLTLKLLVRHQEKLVPTIGGVLLFGKERAYHFSDAWVQCGRFVGTNKVTIFDHIEIYDHLPLAVDRIMDFLKKHAMRSADLSEIRRKDIWSIPLSILREVVINALVHSDYSQRGAPIRVSFFDDRIEIENPGILLPGLTVEDMRQGVSKIRNHLIARVFRELKLIEQWGSGVRRIFEEAKELGLPEPQIIEIGMRVRFVIPLALPIVIKPLTEQVKPKTEQVIEQVTEQVKGLLKCLSKKPLAIKEAMLCVQLRHRPTFIYEYLQPAIDVGFVEMTQPDSPKSPTQKYRLTELGKQNTEQATEQVAEQVTEQVAEQVTEQVKRLLECLNKEPLSIKEAMLCVQLKHRPTFIYDYLQPAIEAGLVEMTQPESPKSPTQKYRLTNLGKKKLR